MNLLIKDAFKVVSEAASDGFRFPEPGGPFFIRPIAETEVNEAEGSELIFSASTTFLLLPGQFRMGFKDEKDKVRLMDLVQKISAPSIHCSHPEPTSVYQNLIFRYHVD
jgi:hypothetical protein